MTIQGVLIPLITPFKEGKIDFDSYKNMIKHYENKGIKGFIPVATTGETPTLSEYEYESIIEKTVEYNDKKIPIYVGFGGNNTEKMAKEIKILEKYDVQGVLSVSPYYNRPDQRGIYEHFKRISEATAMDIIIYNIPYRTGRNIENDTLRRLAEFKNIVGVKDCCGDFNQSMELLLNRPKEFSILTGEDAYFFSTLALGGDGGIMASAHINTEKFVEVYKKMKDNKHVEALKIWREIAPSIPLLFKEPNPAPVKYCLSKQGIISTDQVRLPLVNVSSELAKELNNIL